MLETTRPVRFDVYYVIARNIIATSEATNRKLKALWVCYS